MARFVLDPDRSRVEIAGSSSIHPVNASASGITGHFDLAVRSGSVAAKPALAGEVSIEVDRLQSGNPLVDRETRRRIDARKFPQIVGTAGESELLDPNRIRVDGEITFRGETVVVQGELDVEFGSKGVRLTGKQRLDVREWGLKLPRIGLLRVHPDVEVSIDLLGTKQ